MIQRGDADGRIHTSWCSAANHHRTTNIGACCLCRQLWIALPRRVQLALFAALVAALTLVAWEAVWLLFAGVVG